EPEQGMTVRFTLPAGGTIAYQVRGSAWAHRASACVYPGFTPPSPSRNPCARHCRSMSVAREVTPMMTNGRRGAEAAVTPPRLGRVLLLEDEKDVAELIRYNLAKEGYGVLLT